MKLTREEAEAIYDAGKERVVEVLLAMSEGFEQIEVLKRRIEALERQLKQNSQNSHKPPSSDGYRKPAPKSQRKRSGRRSGGQAGHTGTTLAMSDTPDHVTDYWPERCGQCQRELGHTHASGCERRQVHDMPPVQIEVTEHRAMQVCCAQCGAVTQAVFPAQVQPGVQYGHGVAALAIYAHTYQLLPLERTAELMRDLAGRMVSEGTLVNLLASCAERVAPIEQQIKQAIILAPVAHFDETGLRVCGQLNWLHVASTDRLTYYAVDAKRGTLAHERIGILPHFTGVAIHDAYASYLQRDGPHGLCNAHLVRELTALEESTRQHWPTRLKTLLFDVKARVDQAHDQGRAALAPEVMASFEAEYNRLIRCALRSNPRPVRLPGQRGRARASPACNLAERLRDHQDSVLRFMYDFRVPFDNNQAERDLRMLKVKQKVSGCFRSAEGAHLFARLRGYLSTVRKQGYQALAALRDLLDGRPVTLQLA